MKKAALLVAFCELVLSRPRKGTVHSVESSHASWDLTKSIFRHLELEKKRFVHSLCAHHLKLKKVL
jgi:hypothetical protein